VWYHGRCGSLSSWAFSSMVDALQAVRFLEQKRTNSGPFMESTSKHSIYTPTMVYSGWQGEEVTPDSQMYIVLAAKRPSPLAEQTEALRRQEMA